MTFSTWRAAGESAITSAACLRALLALCSPSAAITWPRVLRACLANYLWVKHTLALAFLAASASAAMALISCSGTLTSLTCEYYWNSCFALNFATQTSTLSTNTPHGSVASCRRSCISLAIDSLPRRIPCSAKSKHFFVIIPNMPQDFWFQGHF